MNHEFINQKFIDKFTKLRFRISFKARESHSLGELEVINDMDWVKRKIEDLSGGIVIDITEFGKANQLWKQYSDTGITEDSMWGYIDTCLTAKMKIEAIKTYRKFTGSGLREAKNVIDAREMKNKGLI